MPLEPLPIYFALHDPAGAYWVNTAVAMTSAAHHARGPIAFHLLHDDTVGEKPRRRLGEIAEAIGVPLTFHRAAVPSGKGLEIVGPFSPATLFRLMIPEIASDQEVVLYLDSDLVVNGLDICELAAAAAPDAPISAVVDPFIRRIASHAAQLDALGLDEACYFNAGVLALRPKLLPSTLMEEYFAFVQRHGQVLHPDQDFLNVRFAREAHLVDERFNTIIGFDDQRMTRPLAFYANRVLHYATRVKPMSGALSPALIPFFVHMFMTPELYLGAAYDPAFYLFPLEGQPNLARGKPIQKDPG